MQDGDYYVFKKFTYAVFSWQTDLSVDLVASDFIKFVFDVEHFEMDHNLNPYFSVSGSPISFGFYTANSTSTSPSSPSTKIIGYDNWSVDVHAVPEPVFFLLFTSAIPYLLRRKRGFNTV